MSYMHDQHLLVTASIYYARAATCKILSVLTLYYIDTSLYTSSHTYTYRLRIRTGRPATPCRHSVRKHCAGQGYILRINIIASKYTTVRYREVIPCARARSHAAWHGVSICSTPLRARLSEGVERRSRRRCRWWSCCVHLREGERRKPMFCRLLFPTANPRIAFESEIHILFTTWQHLWF